MITRHSKTIGEHRLYYAVCDQCGWIKNRWGQFVWERYEHRNHNIRRHNKECHAKHGS